MGTPQEKGILCTSAEYRRNVLNNLVDGDNEFFVAKRGALSTYIGWLQTA
jgi:hypothetical protein